MCQFGELLLFANTFVYDYLANGALLNSMNLNKLWIPTRNHGETISHISSHKPYNILNENTLATCNFQGSTF